MIKNQVLKENARFSCNFYESDLVLQDIILHNFSKEGVSFMEESYQYIGRCSAGEMNKLSMLADKNPPQLIKRNFYGEEVNLIEFHPSYNEMMKIALKSNMLSIKWNKELRERFSQERHGLGFASFFIYAMSEIGQHCPLCMTDGVAKVIDEFGDEDDKERILEAISSDSLEEFQTGAMFLTEKSGGSDVGRNIVKADKIDGKYYRLNGEKWFCSNANAELILALGRTNPEVEGTRGLSLFLIEKINNDGSENYKNMVRLKDKLGVKSMASAEIILQDTIGKRIGEEGEGFKIMAKMVNLSRIHNAIASTAQSRRALIEAYQFTKQRETFKKTLISHPLVRTKLEEIGALNIANMMLLWRAIKAMDLGENGDLSQLELLRILTPMLKKWSAQEGVYITRESMELMGGIGYIEDGVMPKIFRDILVTPIWEGSGNIQYLDMLRALFKTKGLDVMTQEIDRAIEANLKVSEWMKLESEKLQNFKDELNNASGEDLEASLPKFFDRLTNLYQVAICINSLNSTNEKWIFPTIEFLSKRFSNDLSIKSPLKTEQIDELIAWDF